MSFFYMSNKLVIKVFSEQSAYQMDVISFTRFTQCNIFIFNHCFQYVSSMCIYSFLLICESTWLHVYNGTAHKENKKMENLYFYSGISYCILFDLI